MPPVRLKDIAQDLGVSVVTVSKVLRNHPDVGPQTREKVMRRVVELNYRPNLAARALVTGQTFTIGLIVPDLVHSFFAEVALGATRVLRAKDYSLVISSSDEDGALERSEMEQLSRRVDALLIASTQAEARQFEALRAARFPFVLIDRRIEGMPAAFVGVDDEAVGFLATRHLLEVGCRRVAHIGGLNVSTAVGRTAGYFGALREMGVERREGYVVSRQNTDHVGDSTGFEAMNRLLRLDPRPDGVFCFNDPTAMGAMKAIFAAGLRIPQDIAVVGAGNVRYADFFRVPLTSVDQTSEALGERAAELALEMVGGRKAKPPKTVLLQPKLIVRESSRRNA
jgi:LacI family transcriptional regulator